MAEDSNRLQLGEHSSLWLDGDHIAADVEGHLSQDEQSQIADLQLVHALLATLPTQVVSEKERRVRRVMTAINSPPQKSWPQLDDRLRSALAVAAVLLLGLSLVWTQFNRESHAGLILRQIAAATIQNVDRVYHLQRTNTGTTPEPAVEGKLYLRGREGFVLRCGEHVLGRHGDDYWIVPKQGHVLLADDFQWMVAESEPLAGEIELLKHLSEDSGRVPMMQLSAVVELMEHDYQVKLRHQDSDNSGEQTIEATRKDERGSLPQTITLTASAETKIIRRAEFSWGPRTELALELAPFEPVPIDWYTPEAHYDDDRQQRRVSH